MDTYPNFRAFVDQAVKPHRDLHPRDRRLDGATSGGNREVFGRFMHGGRRWKVHADTHYAPLFLAYNEFSHRPDADPFVEESTSAGSCLVLRPQLRGRQGTRAKYLYIYSD